MVDSVVSIILTFLISCIGITTPFFLLFGDCDFKQKMTIAFTGFGMCFVLLVLKCEEEFFDYQTIECDKKTKQHFHVGCEKL